LSKEKITRRKYLKYAGGAIAAAAIAAAGYGAYKYLEEPVTPTPEGRKVVKIGGTKPFTGPDAPPGISEGNGNKLWAERVNEAGGIKAGDGKTYEVELITYNDEQKPENVPRLYEKLITEDQVDFLFGPVWGPLGMATVPIVEKYKKFEVFGTAAFDPEAYKDWKYIVHVITNGPYYMANLIDMIIERVLPDDPEAKNIAVTYGDDAFRRTAGYYGYQYAVDKGFNVVMHEQYHSATTDLSPLLTKVKAAKPTIYLNAGVFTDAILLVRQMIELDLNVKMLWTGTGTVFPKFHEELEKYAEGLVTMSQWEKGVVYEHDYGPSHDEFIEAYENKYGETPDYHAGTGYQQGLVIQRCMELSDDPLNSESIRRLAGELDMTTFFGKFNVTPETGWQEGHKMACVQWQNGEKEVVWPMESAKELWYPIKKWSERT